MNGTSSLAQFCITAKHVNVDMIVVTMPKMRRSTMAPDREQRKVWLQFFTPCAAPVSVHRIGYRDFVCPQKSYQKSMQTSRCAPFNLLNDARSLLCSLTITLKCAAGDRFTHFHPGSNSTWKCSGSILCRVILFTYSSPFTFMIVQFESICDWFWLILTLFFRKAMTIFDFLPGKWLLILSVERFNGMCNSIN